jgi:hypothetical protein
MALWDFMMDRKNSHFSQFLFLAGLILCLPTFILDAIAASVTDQMAHWILEFRSNGVHLARVAPRNASPRSTGRQVF